MNGQKPTTVFSPLRGLDLIDTFNVARILFPDERISQKHMRFVQRLCEEDLVESFKLGGRYHVRKSSVFAYIEDIHYLGRRRNERR